MNAVHENKLNMYRGISVLFAGAPEIVALVPALGPKLTQFQTLVAAIPGLAETQAQPTSGAVTGKKTAIETMADASLLVAGAVASYAEEKNLPELAAKVHVTPSTFLKGRAQERTVIAQQIHDAALPVVAELADYNVTAAALTDLQTKIDAATAALSAPRAVVTAKAGATQQLPPAFHVVDRLLEHQIDPLVLPLKKTQPAFWAKYQVAREIVNYPGGHGGHAAGTPPPAPPAAPAA